VAVVSFITGVIALNFANVNMTLMVARALINKPLFEGKKYFTGWVVFVLNFL